MCFNCLKFFHNYCCVVFPFLDPGLLEIALSLRIDDPWDPRLDQNSPDFDKDKYNRVIKELQTAVSACMLF